MIAVIDYDMGNVGSIKNILKKITDESVVITNDLKQLSEADKYILPGVGSFDAGMANLKLFNLIDVLNKEVLVNKKPLLGICLGMQLLGTNSEEGSTDGLGFIPFKTVRFNASNEFKIPHMGWNYVSITDSSDKLTYNLTNEKQRYYFVHSYHAVCDNTSNILMECDYCYKFTAAVKNNNIYGVQFHPEKSHKFGMKLLSNFVEL